MKLLTKFFLIFLLNHSAMAAKSPDLREIAFYSHIVGEVTSGKITSEEQADVYTIPASCLKVITALLAYKILGKDHSFRTELYEAGQDVILKFGGDMTLTSAKLTLLLRAIKDKLKQGNLIIDNSTYIAHPYSTNLITGDRGKKYAKPISALVIDQNEITIKISPTEKGRLANLAYNSELKINNQIISSSEPSNISAVWEEEVLTLTGNISTQEQFVEKIVTPIKIESYALDKLKKIINSLGLNTPISIVNDELILPSEKKLLSFLPSATLDEIIPQALEASDNLTFDILFLNIIHKALNKKIRDWGEGNMVIKNLINERLGVDIEKSIIADGSGLSFYNRIKPRFLYEILQKNYTDNDFFHAMPKVDYINKSFETPILPSYIKAKTGSLLGFRCLCGFDTRKANPKAFVVMANGFEPLSKNINQDMANFATFLLR